MAAHNNDSERNSRAGTIRGRFSNKTGVRLILFTVLVVWLILGVCGCGQSSPVNASPTLSVLSPVSAKVGGSSFTITVTGTAFVPASLVQWNGSNRPTTFVSNTQITAQISASDIAALGKAAITVFTPAPGGGTSGSLPFNILARARFAYITDFGTSRISTLAVHPATGQLLYTGYALAESSNPIAVALDPSGRFAYVVNQETSGSVSMFSINTDNGVLTSIAPAISAGDTPSAIALDPMGRFAYVANLNSNTISIYAINSTTGALTAIGSGTVAAGTQPHAIAADPSGKFLFVANQGSNNISMFSINSSIGTLNPIGSGTIGSNGSNPNAIAIDPTGRFAYVANDGGTVAMFSVDTSTGALTSIGAPIAAGTSPSALAVDPTGRFVYVANFASNDVSAFAINSSSGALTSLGATVATGQGPKTVAVSPSGDFVYVGSGNAGAKVSVYSVDATAGTLTKAGTAAARGNPTSLALSQGTKAVTQTAKFLYLVEPSDGPFRSPKIWMFTADATGALTATSPPSLNVPPQPVSAVTDPYGRFVYIAQANPSAVEMFTIDSATGILAPTTPATVFGGPIGGSTLAVDPTGRFVYAADSGQHTVSAYAINAQSGLLTLIGTVPAGGGLTASAVDPSGAFLYVTSNPLGVLMFTIDPATGILTPTSPASVPASIQPQYMTVDPTGRFVYVTNFDEEVSMYSIDSSTGVLNSLSFIAAGGFAGSIGSIAVDRSGRFAYMVNSGSIRMFSIDGSTGVLSSPVAVTGGAGLITLSGNFLYATGGGGILAFTIDSSTGLLVPATGADGKPLPPAPFGGAVVISLVVTGTTQ